MGVQHPDIREDSAVNDPQTVEIPDGQKAVFTWQPENSGTTFVLPELAASKRTESSYTVKTDGRVRFEAAIPPTDIDDSGQTWLPAITFESELKFTIRNFGDTTRVYHVQPKGWETTDSLQEGN